jgi:glycosyltransferase involved in cell wall biosynthesis
MRVVLVGFADFPHGRAAARRIHMIAKEMAAQGCEVSVIIPFALRHGPTQQKMDGFRVTWCYVPTSVSEIDGYGRLCTKGRILGRVRLLWKIVLMSLRRQYDWLYLYTPGIEGVLSALMARMTGRKVVSEYCDERWQEPHPSLARRMLYRTFAVADIWVPRLSNVIFVISALLEDKLCKIAPKVKVMRVPPLVDAHLFASGNREVFRERLGLSVCKVIVYAGTFWVVEGVANLIEAMSLVARQHEDVRLVIAGGRSVNQSDDVPILIKQYGLSDKAIVLGNLPLREVVDLLAAADVLVSSKIDHSANRAGVPTKLAEYLAAGRPVVSSNIGDISLYLHHGKDALLCEPGNVSELAESISTLLFHKDLADRISQQGQRLAYEVFDVASNTARMLTAMEQAD